MSKFIELVHIHNMAEAATLRLQVGVKKSDKGKETPLFASVRVPGTGIRTIEQALVRLQNLPKIGVKLPKADADAVLHLKLSPVIRGDIAAVLFCEYGGYRMDILSVSQEIVDEALSGVRPATVPVS